MADTPENQGTSTRMPPRTALTQLSALQWNKRNAARPKRRAAQAGIQSLEAGLALLKTLVDAARPMKLKEIAEAARMSPSKAHRYMVSLCRADLAMQDDRESTYRLGPYALEMAIACFNSLRPVKLASEALEAISLEIDLTVAIAAWGNHGPTIVRIEESSHAVSMNVRAGTVAPLTRSASGLVFAAFMPAHATGPMITAEFASVPKSRRGAARRSLQRVLQEIRRSGIASVSQKLVPGADALAAPIFDHRGRITLALLAVGSSGSFDLSSSGFVAEVLRRYAGTLSAKLGGTPEAGL